MAARGILRGQQVIVLGPLGAISGFGGCHESPGAAAGAFVGTLRPGTPGPWGQLPSERVNRCSTAPKRSPGPFGDGGACRLSSAPSKAATIDDYSAISCAAVNCHKCGESFGKLEALKLTICLSYAGLQH
ncbi:hypothetical protein J5N97_001002 [Dioscorea zingiberensis]|uniref:Uncharacterized protein n=1 Tax=Dioscorea zingiberensis TaxID=325984 RepID=A0A9D5BUH3_9LILI|nr:hypothetical protein J5N97_001002 [Dioscorea zingiberensis]